MRTKPLINEIKKALKALVAERFRKKLDIIIP
jgi:hypothetical protein